MNKHYFHLTDADLLLSNWMADYLESGSHSSFLPDAWRNKGWFSQDDVPVGIATAIRRAIVEAGVKDEELRRLRRLVANQKPQTKAKPKALQIKKKTPPKKSRSKKP